MRFRRRNNGNRNEDDDIRNDDNDDEGSTTGNSKTISESDVSYSIESFNAVATPVTITMVLSAFAVKYINTEETMAAGEEIFGMYEVLDVDDDDSSAQKLGRSLVNTLVIVSVLCAMTFLVVLCYKYKCKKLFTAYMVLVTAALLGYFTSLMWIVALSIYPWMGRVDKLTFAYLIYNYTIVGTLSIFLPRGFPRWIPQGYLIAGSVCMAWQLSYFNAWMTWTLLVMLALYDMFAVLTPCGPLKALAKMISGDGAQTLPGMIYEARIPAGETSTSTQRKTNTESHRSADSAKQQEIDSTNSICENGDTSMSDSSENDTVEDRKQRSAQHRHEPTEQSNNSRDSVSNNREIAIPISRTSATIDSDAVSNQGLIPLALAIMYRIPVLDAHGVLQPDDIQEIEWTPTQLGTEVTCIFPTRGGRIAKAKPSDQKYNSIGTTYIVFDRYGNEQRKFVVTPLGSVREVKKRKTNNKDKKSTIKLGIGDFIFYSVLVSQAGQYSFTAFVSCLLVVLSGLAATLVILAIKGKALPALPISIFLGVITFLSTKAFCQPWIDDLNSQSMLV